MLDPSLRKVSERLKQGFVFEKFQYSSLPSISEDRDKTSSSISFLPKSSQILELKGVDFGNIDVDKLVLYDEALKLDEDPAVARS